MMQTAIRQWGNGQGIRFSKTFLEKANLKVGDILEAEDQGDSIVLRKRPRHRSFEERLAEYNGVISISDYDWGEPAGKEML